MLDTKSTSSSLVNWSTFTRVRDFLRKHERLRVAFGSRGEQRREVLISRLDSALHGTSDSPCCQGISVSSLWSLRRHVHAIVCLYVFVYLWRCSAKFRTNDRPNLTRNLRPSSCTKLTSASTFLSSDRIFFFFFRSESLLNALLHRFFGEILIWKTFKIEIGIIYGGVQSRGFYKTIVFSHEAEKLYRNYCAALD